MQQIDSGDGEEDECADQGEDAKDLCFKGEEDEQGDKYEFAYRKTAIEVEDIDFVFEVMKDIIREKRDKAVKEYYPESTLSVPSEETNKEDHG